MSTNQRSVIAKSINNQVVDVPPEGSVFSQISMDSAELTHSSPEYSLEYPVMDNNSLSKRIAYICPSALPSPNSSVMSPSEGDYESLYTRYDLIQAKRKAIPVPYENKDDAYWERRRRNNESAKRSREIRRIRESQTTKRIFLLEQQNVKLEAEVKFLREEIKRLRETEFFPYLLRTSIK